MIAPIQRAFDDLPSPVLMQVLLKMLHDLTTGQDETISALRAHAEAAGASMVIVGGVAVIRHGYRRTTDDRDFLVHHHSVRPLVERLIPSYSRSF